MGRLEWWIGSTIIRTHGSFGGDGNRSIRISCRTHYGCSITHSSSFVGLCISMYIVPLSTSTYR
jgi:hypothetical protein